MTQPIQFPNQGRQRPGQQPAGQTVEIAGAGIGVYGLKAEFHVQRHMAKLQKHPTDAGFDIYPTSTMPDEEVIGDWVILWVHTAFHFIVPPQLVGLLRPRSSSPKTLAGGLVIEGTIDGLYTGEIKVRVQCLAERKYEVLAAINQAALRQVAIAQIIMTPYVQAIPQVLQALPVFGHGRNSNGFGSTDQNG